MSLLGHLILCVTTGITGKIKIRAIQNQTPCSFTVVKKSMLEKNCSSVVNASYYPEKQNKQTNATAYAKVNAALWNFRLIHMVFMILKIKPATEGFHLMSLHWIREINGSISVSGQLC